MNAFVQAVKNQEARTQNNMKARISTADAVVDLFYKIGASRGKNIIPAFTAAYNEDSNLALRVALWSRDVRGGAGERKLFRDILSYLEKTNTDDAVRLLNKTPLVGRWDDIQEMSETATKTHVFEMLKKALEEKNGLAAKWIPRKGPFAVEFRNYLGWSPKRYRKTLVELTKVVEQQMCAKQWNEINYNHVPSVAAKKYRKAFFKNDKERFEAYVNAVTKSETFEGQKAKINASAIFPHDVIKEWVPKSYYLTVKETNKVELDAMVAQWEALPNYIQDGSILPLVDVSGSMTMGYHMSGGLQPLTVAVSLGLYCADKNKGPFADTFLTFTSTPKLYNLKGNIVDKINQMVKADWHGSTDLHKALELILKVAVGAKVPQEEMPTTLLILSDMQFNMCVKHDDSAIEMIRRKYQDAGYQMPQVVFWNLNSNDNVPVKFDESGTALVSGFSPSILKAILAQDHEQFTPRGVMLRTIMSERYDV